MKRKVHPSIQQMIEDQAHKWQLHDRERQKSAEPPPPVVYLSRETGANGDLIAAHLAKITRYDLFDRALIRQIAESGQASEAVVETLDEKTRSALVDWISSLAEDRHFWFDDYLEHLSKVIGAIGRHGGAIIVGRGAGYLLAKTDCACLRVRVIASPDTKVKRVMEREHLSAKDAKKHIAKTEGEQRAFLKRYFSADIGEPRNYDLVLNTDCLSIEEAAEAIRGALVKLAERPREG
jgi:cytidylate kinase